MSSEEIDLTPSPRLLEVLGDIPLQPWQCLAELIDNALDELVRDRRRFEVQPLRVDIDVHEPRPGVRELIVRDNGIGMDRDGLAIAMRAGATTKGRYGTLGLFGMGFNIATARLGKSTTVVTTRAGDTDSLQTTLDFAELQRTEKFRVPLKRLPKRDFQESGTEVRVQLKREMSDFFASSSNLNILRSQLGDVYSFLLREQVPGITRPGHSSLIQASIYVAGQRVTAKLPCVWGDNRSVQSYGQAVHAIQYINVSLTDATACLVCGYWDRTNGPETCEECGSDQLELRSRRVWGWLGVQRYIDSSHYGIDFLRFGRKILKQDKSLFRYTDPDTLQEDVEYPIEMPANQGRLVGEIHLDHVQVTYQKNDFIRQSRDWVKAVEILRGVGPMKPRGARNENTSPLARLFSAYRRNDPGLRYLTPGDGTRAIHAKAREWAAYFDREVPRYVNDDLWYERAEFHERGQEARIDSQDSATVVPGVSPAGSSPAPMTDAPRSDSGPSAFERLVETRRMSTEQTAASPVALTRDQVLQDARSSSNERVDLSDVFTLPNRMGEWTVSVRETNRRLVDQDGFEVPATISSMTGSAIEVLVNREHQIFRDFGRDVRDVALIQVAEAVVAMTPSRAISVSTVYSSLVQLIEDLRSTPAALQETAHDLFKRIREMIYRVIESDPTRYWESLSAIDKQRIELRAASDFPTVSLSSLVDDGRFSLLLDGKAIAALIRFDPLKFFDNKVFRASLEHRHEIARAAIIQKVVRSIEGVSDFLDNHSARQSDDIALARVQVDSLTRQLRSQETL